MNLWECWTWYVQLGGSWGFGVEIQLGMYSVSFKKMGSSLWSRQTGSGMKTHLIIRLLMDENH